MKNKMTSSTSKMKKALAAIAICGVLTGGSAVAGISAASAKSSTVQQDSPWASTIEQADPSGSAQQTNPWTTYTPTKGTGGFSGWGVSWQ